MGTVEQLIDSLIAKKATYKEFYETIQDFDNKNHTTHRVRVKRVNGVGRMVTQDYIPSRINCNLIGDASSTSYDSYTVTGVSRG